MSETKHLADKYADMLDMSHHISQDRPRMSLYDRAAQFGSFAALTGHEAAIAETARHTETWTEPDDEVKEQLNRKLQILQLCLDEKPEASVTYFQPDALKTGGSYEQFCGNIKKIDGISRNIIFSDGTHIPMELITELEIGEG